MVLESIMIKTKADSIYMAEMVIQMFDCFTSLTQLLPYFLWLRETVTDNCTLKDVV
jgi:hypothetical protein